VIAGRLAAIGCVVLAVACGNRAEPTPPPDPIVTPAPDPEPAPVPVATDAAFAEPPPDPVAGGACQADAQHCCLPDGTLVVPGGCQPIYPNGVEPATDRAADGSCVRIECHLKCLPESARIATPEGEVPVTRLAVGDPIWTTDERGARIAGRVARVGSVERRGPHAIVEVTLADGRVVRASAGHPDATGRRFGDLAAGDLLDGSTVRAIRMVGYEGERTWDVRPDGATGAYWADGVLVGSTL
jgi:hypothetical protein